MTILVRGQIGSDGMILKEWTITIWKLRLTVKLLGG
jgi:hypothetical protein